MRIDVTVHVFSQHCLRELVDLRSGSAKEAECGIAWELVQRLCGHFDDDLVKV
jgi:hypothetical protein